MIIAVDRLREQLDEIFASWGMIDTFRGVCVRQVIEADLMGIDSHGIGMLPIYEKLRVDGRIVVNPDVTVVDDHQAVALVDAGHGMGHIAATKAMELAMEKARKFGVGVASVRCSNHYGAAGVYSNMARRSGLLGLSITGTTQRSVVPTFGREPRFSTNPLAFAAPGGKTDGFSLDMATSTVAIGKIAIAKREGKSIPPGWAIDPSGQPETDPVAALEADPKRLTPLGGTRELGSHKGYGLAIMVDILGSILSDSFIGGYSLETGERGKFLNVGHFFLAIDPVAFRREPGAFETSLDRLVGYLRATPAIDPDQPVLVAGDPEFAAYKERTEQGIPVTESLIGEISDVCESCHAKFVLK
ncbi:MAG: Ldh family oxidoreductase [Deltaproteobacteria bacterium]|nr:Ldh family oxidoreductase [Deltaproteobacteria bacterium]